MKEVFSYVLNKKLVYTILAFIFLLLHFLCISYSLKASSESAEVSSSVSEKVTEEVIEVIEAVDKDFTYDFDDMNTKVRKIVGHYGLFLVSAIFGVLSLIFFNFNLKITFSINVIMGFIYASLSELMQLTSKGRSCEVKDIFIDYFGYLSGIIITCLIIMLVYFGKIKKLRLNNKA